LKTISSPLGWRRPPCRRPVRSRPAGTPAPLTATAWLEIVSWTWSWSWTRSAARHAVCLGLRPGPGPGPGGFAQATSSRPEKISGGSRSDGRMEFDPAIGAGLPPEFVALVAGLVDRVEKLEAENAALRAENETLRAENAALEAEIKAVPESCPGSEADLTGKPAELFDRRQVAEFVEKPFEVREIQQYRVLCDCGKMVEGQPPSDVLPGFSLGPRLTAFIGLLGRRQAHWRQAHCASQAPRRAPGRVLQLVPLPRGSARQLARGAGSAFERSRAEGFRRQPEQVGGRACRKQGRPRLPRRPPAPDRARRPVQLAPGVLAETGQDHHVPGVARPLSSLHHQSDRTAR